MDRSDWSTVETLRPDRRTVTRSEISATSSIRCEMNRMAVPLGCEPAHLDEEPIARADVQGSCRLVEDEHLGLSHECPGNADGLPLGERELAGGKIERNLAGDARRGHPARLSLLGVAQPATERSVGPKPDILEDRLAPRGEDLLEHRRNPQVHGRSGRSAGYGDAVQCDGAGIRAVDASHDLDEGTLPEPFSPRSVWISPGRRWRSPSIRARVAPKRLLTRRAPGRMVACSRRISFEWP